MTSFYRLRPESFRVLLPCAYYFLFYLNLNGIKYERKSEKDPGRSTCSKMTSSCKCLQMQVVQMFIVFYCLLINPTTYLQQRP